MTTEPIDKFAALMTLEDFVKACEVGAFIDYDGFGYYSDGKVQFPEEIVSPSDIMKGSMRPDRSHVVWFNR